MVEVKLLLASLYVEVYYTMGAVLVGDCKLQIRLL